MGKLNQVLSRAQMWCTNLGQLAISNHRTMVCLSQVNFYFFDARLNALKDGRAPTEENDPEVGR